MVLLNFAYSCRNLSKANMHLQNSKKVINAWCSYDIANSSYKLIITTVLFPIFYGAVTKEHFGSEMVSFLGWELQNTVLYDYAMSLAYLVVAFVSPLLSGIADYSSKRKRFMQFFTVLGSSACFFLYWFDGGNLVLGMLLVMFAAIGFEGGELFYNSFLPQIASKDQQDRVSARGYSWGYAGSMLLLIVNLIIIQNYEAFNFKNELEALRTSFIQVGLWWFFIAMIAFIYLKDFKQSEKKDRSHLLLKGFKEIQSVFQHLRGQFITKRFLAAFFFYSMGLQTLMLVAIMFGQQEIGIEGSKLIVTIVILQMVAIVGATFFGWVSRKVGNKKSITYMLLIWLAVCIGGYFIQTTMHFYILAAGVGLVMGGIQSQSRSTYSKLIPKGSVDTASYFSYYNMTEKIAIVIGMFSFGFIHHLTGNMRNSTIALGVYFLIALVIILSTPLDRINENLDH